MEAISLLMFALPMILAFVFTLLGAYELKDVIIDENVNPFLALLFLLIAVPLWFVDWIVWTALALEDMYVYLGWLWFGFGWICVVLVFLAVGYSLKHAVQNKDQPRLRLEVANREDNP